MIVFTYLSIVSNLVLAIITMRLYLKLKSVKARPESVELQEFLMDLLSGGGLVHVKRVASADVVMRVRRQ